MSQPGKIGKIEIEEDVDFLHKEWRFQRVAWAVIALVLAAAALGAFGRGPISHTSAGDTQTLQIDYERITRHGAANDIAIRIGAAAPRDSIVHLAISRSFIDAHHVESIAPEPAQQRIEGDLLVYSFARRNASTMHIELKVRPLGYGARDATVQIVGSSALRIKQFIMP